jgi:hypothetical protein
MLEFVYTGLALCFIFLLGSVFGERDVKYGYVLIPLFGAAFALFGWLPPLYASTIIPLVLGLAVITFLREQFREKFAGGGSASSLIWKVMAFVVFLQFALVFVNGLAIMQESQTIPGAVNTTVTQTYTIENAQYVYGNYTSPSSIDQLSAGLTLVWTSWTLTWTMIWGMFTIYPNMINIFHMPQALSLIISAGFYIMLGIEVFVLLMFRTRPPEI